MINTNRVNITTMIVMPANTHTHIYQHTKQHINIYLENTYTKTHQIQHTQTNITQ